MYTVIYIETIYVYCTFANFVPVLESTYPVDHDSHEGLVQTPPTSSSDHSSIRD